MAAPLDATRTNMHGSDSSSDMNSLPASSSTTAVNLTCLDASTATGVTSTAECRHDSDASVAGASTTASSTFSSDRSDAASVGTPSATITSTAAVTVVADAAVADFASATQPPQAARTSDAVVHAPQDQPRESNDMQEHVARQPTLLQCAELSVHAAASTNTHSLANDAAGQFTPIQIAMQPPLPHNRLLSPTGAKRKRSTDDTTTASAIDNALTPPRRKGSGDYLRKGQWTATEEKLARALIEAFESGFLPIFTGIRLRGYLAVQLQCDPMRISKKLCGGSVDGRVVPKNYGQKKFKASKKPTNDANAEAAASALARLEELQNALWTESGLARPAFLTLSTTRNASDSSSELAHAIASPQDDATSSSSSSSSERESSSRRQSPHTLPIIYLNLSKKPKTSAAVRSVASSAPVGSSMRSTVRSGDNTGDATVDGDSLQAAYELLKLFQAPTETA